MGSLFFLGVFLFFDLLPYPTPQSENERGKALIAHVSMGVGKMLMNASIDGRRRLL